MSVQPLQGPPRYLDGVRTQPDPRVDPWAATRPVPSAMPWPAPRPPQRGGSGRKWALIGGGVAVVAIVASGVAIGAAGGSRNSTIDTATTSRPSAAAPSTTVTPSPVPIVPVEALSGLLVDASTVNTIMGADAITVNPDLTTTRLFVDTTDMPQCGGVCANANRDVYAGSGWTAVQTRYLREPANQDHMLTARVVLEGGQGWSCQHALTARNNVVNADEGSGIAKRIADGTRA